MSAEEDRLAAADNPYTEADEAQPSVSDLLDKFASLNDEAQARPESDDEEGEEDEGAGAEGVDGVEGVSIQAGGEGSGKAKKKKKKKSKAATAVQKLKDLTTGNAIPQELVEQVANQVQQQGGSKDEVDEAAIRKAMKAMDIMKILEGKQALGNKQNTKDLGEHKFWKTQPVPQNLLQGQSSGAVINPASSGPTEPDGPIDPPKTVADVRAEPLKLPDGYEWSTVDVHDGEQLTEVQTLLSENYVEDDDASFRLHYSKEFLLWAFTPPGYEPEWHIGVRVAKSKKLVAFISGIKIQTRVRGNTFTAAEINFLCAHKKLRSKRLAPVLIKEVTRRVNLKNIWQAVYTAGVVLPTPIGTCRYFHRSLNPAKLVDIGFSPLGRGETIARLVKRYAMPAEPGLPGFREMTQADVPQVGALLRRYMSRFDIVQTFETDADVEHWFLSGRGREGAQEVGGRGREGQVVWPYVVEDPATRTITDLVSFYSLPSLIMKHPKHKDLQTAYCYYYASDVPFTPGGSDEDASRKKERLSARLNELIRAAMTIAKQAGFDVFNALSLMDNNLFLQEQLFGVGDGYLNYYLYNWRCAPIDGGVLGTRTRQTSAIGIVML